MGGIDAKAMNTIDKNNIDKNAYDKKTAAFIGFLVQNIPEISDEAMNFWIENPKAMKKVLSGLNFKSQNVRQSFRFRTVDAVTTNLDAIPGKKTKLCCLDSLYSYRADSINSVLPENQWRVEKCFIKVLAQPKGITATFVEQAIALLNVPVDTPVRTLMNFLKARDYIMSLTQIEEMIKITEKKLETGMNSDGADNFCFLENRKQKISVGRLFRELSGWGVDIFEFDDGHRWSDSSHLLVCNLF